MIYLAAPYSHVDREIEHQRLLKIDYLAMRLFKRGFTVYSPITHGCALVRSAIMNDIKLGRDWKTWRKHCLALLSKCDEMWIYKCDDEWNKSIGVAQEIEYCKQHDIDYHLFDDVDFAFMMKGKARRINHAC